MGIRQIRPVNSSSRFQTYADFSEVTAVNCTLGCCDRRRSNSAPVYPLPPATATRTDVMSRLPASRELLLDQFISHIKKGKAAEPSLLTPCRSSVSLSLGVLEALSGALLSVLLPFLDP